MQWHYVVDEQQAGPVSDAELEALLRDGKINQATLVWHEGMPDWQPLASTRPKTPPPFTASLSGTTCAECGRPFPPGELVTLNRLLICAECKPVVLQRLKEGAPMTGGMGLWRQGKKIKTVSETVFPDRCIKCNAPANGFRLKRVLYWHHPAYYFFLLCNLLIFVIVAMIVRKKAVLHIGLCEAHRKQRQVALITFFLGLVGGVVMIAFGVANKSGWLALAGGVVFLFGAIWGMVKGRTIAASKIDKENVWVRGAGKAFLDELPESPD